MELYYTTTSGQDQVQIDPKISLGGYRSASMLPNNSFSNLFDEITQFLLSKYLEDEYIGIILKNEESIEMENLWLWFDYPENCYSKFLVAAVDLVLNSNGILTMERIPNKTSKPLYADFYEANGIVNAVSIGNIAAGGMIGLWFCRRLNEGLLATINSDSNIYEQDPVNEHIVQAKVLDRSESISIQFIWGPEYYGGPIGEELV